MVLYSSLLKECTDFTSHVFISSTLALECLSRRFAGTADAVRSPWLANGYAPTAMLSQNRSSGNANCILHH